MEDFEVVPLVEKSNFVVPFRINYRRNGINRTSDGIKSHSAVAILIYNRDRKSFVFVKQFRPVVYYAYLQNLDKGPNSVESNSTEPGFTLELCAGIVDKPNLTLEQIAAEEVFEECGYLVDPSRLRKISTTVTNEGVTGVSGTAYYVEVGNEDLDPTAGGGNVEENECIEVVYWPVDRADELLTLSEKSIHVTGVTVLAVLWFHLHILPSL
ncbi:hypothetical protein Aperf_G00000058084 [Anoplocephala perfoliata]